MTPNAPTREQVLEQLTRALAQAEAEEAVIMEQMQVVIDRRERVVAMLKGLRSLPPADAN
jgi:hypothetical protein